MILVLFERWYRVDSTDIYTRKTDQPFTSFLSLTCSLKLQIRGQFVYETTFHLIKSKEGALDILVKGLGPKCFQKGWKCRV